MPHEDFKKYLVGMMVDVMKLNTHDNYPPEDPEHGMTYEKDAEEMLDSKKAQSKAGHKFKDPTAMRYEESLLRDLISELLK